MGCEEARLLLDAYVDGELSAEQERALMEHVESCAACREEFNAAVMLQRIIKDMDEDVAVPLEAQAAWRSAVHAEARKKAVRRWTRVASAAAAALVLVLGGAFMLREDVPAQQPAPKTMAVEAQLIAADGDYEDAVVLTAAGESYSARKKYAAQDCEGACRTIEMLAAEYSGSITVEERDGSVICRVELPYDYMADFLSAASRIGTELDSETMDVASETAIIYIQIDETE